MYTYLCLCEFMYITCMQVPEEGQSSLGPGAKATDGCEHLIQALGFTEILRRITTAFTTEPSLQLSVLWDNSLPVTAKN